MRRSTDQTKSVENAALDVACFPLFIILLLTTGAAHVAQSLETPGWGISCGGLCSHLNRQPNTIPRAALACIPCVLKLRGGRQKSVTQTDRGGFKGVRESGVKKKESDRKKGENGVMPTNFFADTGASKKQQMGQTTEREQSKKEEKTKKRKYQDDDDEEEEEMLQVEENKHGRMSHGASGVGPEKKSKKTKRKEGHAESGHKREHKRQRKDKDDETPAKRCKDRTKRPKVAPGKAWVPEKKRKHKEGGGGGGGGDREYGHG